MKKDRVFIVRTSKSNRSASKVGSIYKAKPSEFYGGFYEYGAGHVIAVRDCRLATETEISMYKQGFKTIQQIKEQKSNCLYSIY